MDFYVLALVSSFLALLSGFRTMVDSGAHCCLEYFVAMRHFIYLAVNWNILLVVIVNKSLRWTELFRMLSFCSVPDIVLHNYPVVFTS